MSNYWYPCSALTGGGTGALDALNGSALTDGARAFVLTTSGIYLYWLDDDSAAAESSPDVISPDSNAGDKRWLLIAQLPLSFLAYDSTTLATAAVASATKSIAIGEGASVTGGGSCSGVFQGQNNSIATSTDSVILGGIGNTMADNDESVIVGGYENTMSSAYASTICGGQENDINDSDYSAIVQGYGHEIDSSDESFIGGGSENTIINNCDYCFIGGGSDNTIGTDSGYSSIVGGYFSSMASAEYSVIVGGYNHTLASSADYSIIGGGDSNSISASADHSVIAGGEDNEITQPHGTIPGGHYGKAHIERMFAFSAGRFAATGDSQAGMMIAMAATTNATASVMRINQDSGIDIVLPASRAWRFDIKAVAMQTAGASGTVGDTALWDITGGIKRDDSNNTALVGTPQGHGTPGATDRDAGAAAWDLTITANDTAESLVLTATGEANKTIHWVAKIGIVEVG